MEKLKFVNRDEELSICEKIISKQVEKGKLISLIGIEGIGKTTFFKMLKNEFDSHPDKQILCLMDNVLSADTPLTFFERFFSNLQSKIHPNETKFKSFFKKHADVIQLLLNAGMATAGIPAGSNISKLISTKNFNTLPSLESELINMTTNFEKNFPNQKLVILIDDLDKSDHVDDFLSVLEDIKDNLSRNVTIIMSSTENIVESDTIAPLQRFGEDSVKEFVRENIPTIKEENLYQIVEKSGGYPLALHWLWENYRRNVDINSLLLRLPREGFLQQLQANFLDNLDDDEIKILKICAALDLIDSRIISKVSELGQQSVNEILEYLSLSSILIQINYQELTNKQSIEIYVLDDAFSNLIQSSFGIDIEINKKILRYYFDALSTNLYPIRNQIIGRIINQFEVIGNSTIPKITPQQVLLDLDLDVLKKFDISTEIISHYWLGQKKEKRKDYVAIQFELVKQINDPNYKKLYGDQAELNKLLNEEKYHEAKSLCDETATWLDSFDKEKLSEQEKENLTKMRDYMNAYGNFLTSKGDSGESLLQALFGKENLKTIMSFSKNKIFQCSLMILLLEEAISAQNLDGGLEVGKECLTILNSITKKDVEEFEKLNNSKMKTEHLQLLEYTTKYDLGLLYYLKVLTLIQLKNYDKKELKQNLEKSAEYLEIAKSDPVRGKCYYEVRYMLDKL